MIRYGITSYHRPQCETLRTLLNMGAEPERILVHLNDQRDIEPYAERWEGKAELRYARKYNAAGNRNNILEYLAGTRDDLVILDDDIRSFAAFDASYGKWGRWNTIEEIAELDRYMEECFAKAREVGADIFGLTSTTNSMTTKGTLQADGLWSVNKNFMGGFTGIINRARRFDETYDVQDDYELNLRILKSGGKIIRRNGLTSFRAPMTKAAGGCKEFYDMGLKAACMERMAEEYRGMVKIKKDGTGLVLTWKG